MIRSAQRPLRRRCCRARSGRHGRLSLGRIRRRASGLPAQADAFFRDWPSGTRPEDVGRRVAENYLARPFGFEVGRTPYVVYQEAVTWYGALDFARARTRCCTRAASDPKVRSVAHGRRRAAHLAGEPRRLRRPRRRAARDVSHDARRTLPRRRPSPRRPRMGAAGPGTYPTAARFWVDDLYMLPDRAARGVSRDRQSGVSRQDRRSRRRVSRQSAAAERPVSSRRRRAVLLGSRQRLGSRGAHGAAERDAGVASAARARARRLHENDGGTAPLSGHATACGASSSTIPRRGRRRRARRCSRSRSSRA